MLRLRGGGVDARRVLVHLGLAQVRGGGPLVEGVLRGLARELRLTQRLAPAVQGGALTLPNPLHVLRRIHLW